MMMVVEEPAVELGLPERCLDRVKLHVQSILRMRFATHASCSSADFLHVYSRDDVRCGFLKENRIDDGSVATFTENPQ